MIRDVDTARAKQSWSLACLFTVTSEIKTNIANNRLEPLTSIWKVLWLIISSVAYCLCPRNREEKVVFPPQIFSHCTAQLCLQVYLQPHTVWFGWLLASPPTPSLFWKIDRGKRQRVSFDSHRSQTCQYSQDERCMPSRRTLCFPLGGQMVPLCITPEVPWSQPSGKSPK